ncbi:hypothetical protein Vretimale_6765 [Volvox reticuliferus]|uniref:Uncharacterized protein n=1 Tax=Volvox reticuliferus TaxID=1737510 RepID=A0A8J4CA44_9CHLO|nr:hypothetical protein Vretifemale_7171 [Volvox reticuliferus]GIM02013.1 hypothetical protein Vretimale_6765 [Volvox reticuliferus]
MMESMRARSVATTLSPEAVAVTQNSSSSISEGYPQLTAADGMSPSLCKPLHIQPQVPTSVVETYRGVQFNMPPGCRIEEGEGPSRVRVTGPGLHVTLELRDQGRRVLLVSSNCVCTIRRMGGRMYVNVLPRLA